MRLLIRKFQIRIGIQNGPSGKIWWLEKVGHADLPHPALGRDFTPSLTARRAQTRLGVRARSARKDEGVDSVRQLYLNSLFALALVILAIGFLIPLGDQITPIKEIFERPNIALGNAL